MTVEIETSTVGVGDLSAYLARPAGGSRAGMLLLPMITGIGEQVREYADTIARLGVTAVLGSVAWPERGRHAPGGAGAIARHAR